MKHAMDSRGQGERRRVQLAIWAYLVQHDARALKNGSLALLRDVDKPHQGRTYRNFHTLDMSTRNCLYRIL